MLKALIALFVAFFLTAVLAFGGVWWMYEEALHQPLQLEQEQSLVVQPGQSPSQLLSELERQGLIKGVLWLRMGWRANQTVPAVQVGEYALEPGLTLAGLLHKWQTGDLVRYRITLIEGWSFAKVRQALAANEVLEQQTVELDDVSLMKLLEREGQHPEGRFYPDTYQFNRGQSDLDILRQANRRLEEVLDQEWQQRAPDLPYKDPYEALIMASIVEKETGMASERADIAGVFVRRLNIGMLLQTDPTVIYGMGDSYKGRITRADLRKPTPYNTYVISGLPPTPIALAGREAIHAALQPADGDSLYFVARGDGSHSFSRTLNEHNRAVRQYQLKRRADYRSSPAPAEDVQ